MIGGILLAAVVLFLMYKYLAWKLPWVYEEERIREASEYRLYKAEHPELVR